MAKLHKFESLPNNCRRQARWRISLGKEREQVRLVVLEHEERNDRAVNDATSESRDGDDDGTPVFRRARKVIRV